MTSDRDRRYLTYIHDAIALIEARTRTGREAFLHDVDIQDAVLWRLETLAEATGKLSQRLKDRHPQIHWRAIYGFRNIAAHGYADLMHLIDCILEDQTPIPSGEHARHVIEIIEKAYQSAREGRTLELTTTL